MGAGVEGAAGVVVGVEEGVVASLVLNLRMAIKAPRVMMTKNKIKTIPIIVRGFPPFAGC